MSSPIPKIQLPENCPPLLVLDGSQENHVEMQRSLELAFYKKIRLLSHDADYQLYSMPLPTSIHAYRIWNEAGLPPQTILRLMEVRLLDWVFHHAKVELEGDTIQSVTCYFQEGIVHFLSWKIFLRWMMNACRRGNY